MRLDVDEAELEHGEEAHGPRADDDGVGLDRALARAAANISDLVYGR